MRLGDKFNFIPIALLLVAFSFACSGGGSKDDRILHMSNADITEANLKLDFAVLLADPLNKNATCQLVNSASKEQFFKLAYDTGGRPAGAYSAPVTPVPGQRADDPSKERAYTILKGMCS